MEDISAGIFRKERDENVRDPVGGHSEVEAPRRKLW